VLAVVSLGSPTVVDGPLLEWLIRARALLAPGGGTSNDSPVAIIAVDQRSLAAPELARYPRTLWSPVWAAVLDAVLGAGARTTGFDLLFAYSANEFVPAFDRPLLEALARHRTQVVLARSAGSLPAAPFLAALLNDPDSLGLAELEADADGRFRRVRAHDGTPGEEAIPGLAASLLRRANGPPMPPEVLIAPRRHLERIPTYALIDVLRCEKMAPEALERAFRDRVVLIGSTLPEEDRKLAAGSGLSPARGDGPPIHACGLRPLAASAPDSGTVPGVFLHAAAIEAVMTGRILRIAPVPAVAGLAGVTAVGGATVGLTLAPWFAGGVLVLSASLLLALATAALMGDLWVPLALPVVALGGAAVVAYVVRYLVEERGRRRIQDAFGHYLAPAVVERLAQEPEALRLGGEAREVTVMFADLSGFTAMSGTLAPEELTRLTNQYLGYIVEQVEATGGYVDKFIGDAVMAIWGAPAPEPRHAEHAIQAALGAVARIRAEATAARARGERSYSVKIGINSGPAVVGNVGTERRYNYTAVGETVNVASRLEGVPGLYACQIVVGPRTADLAKGAFLLRELDTIKVKGREAALAIFEPLTEQGAAAPELRDRVERYAEALAHYRAMRFAQAYTIWHTLACEGAATLPTDDGTGELAPDPASRMAERACAYAADPPTTPWDGVWVLTTK
jgi:class 3 adenylate cyclase/CHASE2 domain-containing sensor protein